MNTTSMPAIELLPDAQLVSPSLDGECDAFAQIVACYQSLVCALAYSACGDIARSEDLAQKTFLPAWCKCGTGLAADARKFRGESAS